MINAKHGIHWRYRNLTLAFLGIILTLFLSRLEIFHSFLLHLGNFGYVGAFVAGFLFVSTFTVTTAVLLILVLAETLSPIEIGLIAGLGAVIGDLIIFNLVRDKLSEELEEIYDDIDTKRHLRKLLHTKYFNWMLPVVGAAIIASPLPDEIGVSLIGISRMGKLQFLLVSFILNAIGLFLIVLVSTVIKL